MAKHPNFYSRTKNIEIRYHFVREEVAERKLVVVYYSTNGLQADQMTNPASAIQFHHLRILVCVKVIRSSKVIKVFVTEAHMHKVYRKTL